MDHQLSGILVVALGSFGALAPELVRLYRLREKVVRFSLWYFGISILYAALGGVVAFVLPAITYQAAFYAGISAPVMVSAVAHRRSRRRLRPTGDAVIEFGELAPAPSLKRLFRDHADGLF